MIWYKGHHYSYYCYYYYYCCFLLPSSEEYKDSKASLYTVVVTSITNPIMNRCQIPDLLYSRYGKCMTRQSVFVT